MKQPKIHHIIKHLLKFRKGSILDLGSGDGRIEKMCRIDLATDYYNAAAKQHTNFMKINLEITPYPIDQKFDTILLFGTIHYLKNPKNVLEECYRLLNTGGTLLINFSMNKRLSQIWANKHTKYIKVKRIYTPTSAKFLLKKSGFHIEKELYNSFFGLNRLQFLWKVINFINPGWVYFIARKK